MPQKSQDNETEAVTIRIPAKMLQKLRKEKELFSYLSIQSIILEALRKRYYFSSSGKSKKGRPKGLDLMKAASRKHL
tara:strand:+ start:6442 stop:6672 length:231 start_codon:yes stop_codon:yes gene_type:complete